MYVVVELVAKMIRFDQRRTLNLRLNFVGVHVPYQLPPSSLRLLCFIVLTSMDISPEDLSRVCKRFRVLIIGRRNAGKTTILEKMTGSDEGAKPEIRDKEGHLVVRASLVYLTSIVKLMVIGRPNTC
jgi:hypothetical protein